MDEKEFKKHLADLAHGHHHPEEHDWGAESHVRKTEAPEPRDTPKTAKSIVRPRKKRSK